MTGKIRSAFIQLRKMPRRPAGVSNECTTNTLYPTLSTLVPNLDQAVVPTGRHHRGVNGVPQRAHTRAAVVGLQLAIALAALPVPEVQLPEPVARHEKLPVRTEPDLTGIPNTKSQTQTVS